MEAGRRHNPEIDLQQRGANPEIRPELTPIPAIGSSQQQHRLGQVAVRHAQDDQGRAAQRLGQTALGDLGGGDLPPLQPPPNRVVPERAQQPER